MTSALEYIIVGVSVGGVYALIAVPLSLIWMTTRTIDLAVGGYAVLGGLYAATSGAGAAIAVACGALLGAASGLIFVLLESRPRKNHLAPMLVSVGILFATLSFAQWRLGIDPQYLDWLPGVWSPGGITIRHASLVNLAAIIVLSLLILGTLRGTQLGRWIRACASNPRNASLVGVPVKAIQVGVFTLGGLISAVAGILLVSSRGMSYEDGLNLSLLGLGALILFGMRGILSAVAGAFTLGILEALGAGYLPSSLVPIIPMAVILIVLASGRFDTRIGEVRA